ncbi:MAG: tetratricopeptide repeat protein [bacterium]|nr:tetratricopeptide repeat protein [bacterium]
MRPFRAQTPGRGPLLALLGLLLCGIAAQAQPVDRDDWHAVHTPHFTIYTNAGPQRGGEIAVNLELFRSVFARLAPALELNSPAPSKILAFRDATSYAPYKTSPDPDGGRILGQFLSHRDGNYLTIDAAGTHRVGSCGVIFHEYVHYFVRHNFPGVPLWFNEGLAEYYSTFGTADGIVYVGRPVPRHLRWLQQDGDYSLSDLLVVTQRSPAYHDGEEAGRFYAVSWALVHYLLSSAERLDQTADFLLRLEDGEAPDDAFEEAFGTRLRRIEEKLRAYLAGKLPEAAIPLNRLQASTMVRTEPMPPPDVLYHLGDLLAHIGRPAQAEQHFHLALELDPTHADTHAGLALVRDLAGGYDEAEILYRDAVELRSTNPLTYLLYGRHLLTVLRAGGEIDRKALAERARAAFEKVVGLDPEFGEGYAMLGLAHLVGEPDPAAGIRALERARQLLPTRMDVVFHLVRLRLRNKEFDRAESLIDGVLARRAEPERVQKAREELTRAKLLHAAEEALRAGEIADGLRLYDEATSVTTDPALRERMEEKLLALQERYGDSR